MYPRGMAGKPAEPPPSDRPPGIDGQADAHARGGEREPQHECSGPVAIARHVKGDGRALILYTRDDAPPT
jgi:hypothetical protein